jgi:hypothetical protein
MIIGRRIKMEAQRHFFKVNTVTNKIEEQINFEDIKPGSVIAIYDDGDGYVKYLDCEVLYVEKVDNTRVVSKAKGEPTITITGYSLLVQNDYKDFIKEVQ